MPPRITYRRPHPTQKNGEPLAKSKSPLPSSAIVTTSVGLDSICAEPVFKEKMTPDRHQKAERSPQLKPRPDDATPKPGSYRFAAASPEYHALFASMAIGATTPVPESLSILEQRPSPSCNTIEVASKTQKYSTCYGGDDEMVMQDEVSESNKTSSATTTSGERSNNDKADKPRSTSLPISVSDPAEENSVWHEGHSTKTSQYTGIRHRPKSLVVNAEVQELFTSTAVRPKSQHCEPRDIRRSLFVEPDHSRASMVSNKSKAEDPLLTQSGAPCRPVTTDLVARRMIGAALGINLARKTDRKTVEIEKAPRRKESRGLGGT